MLLLFSSSLSEDKNILGPLNRRTILPELINNHNLIHGRILKIRDLNLSLLSMENFPIGSHLTAVGHHLLKDSKSKSKIVAHFWVTWVGYG